MRTAINGCFLQDPCHSLLRNVFDGLAQVERGFEVAKIHFEGTSRFRKRRVPPRVNRFTANTNLHNIILYSRSLCGQKVSVEIERRRRIIVFCCSMLYGYGKRALCRSICVELLFTGLGSWLYMRGYVDAGVRFSTRITQAYFFFPPLNLRAAWAL